MRDKLAAQGISVGSSTPAELAQHIKADTARLTIIKASGARK